MHIINFFNGFQLHNYFIIANKVGDEFTFQLSSSIICVNRLLTFKRYLISKQFQFQCILVHLLCKTTTKEPMNSHCRTDNVVSFLLVFEIFHYLNL